MVEHLQENGEPSEGVPDSGNPAIADILARQLASLAENGQEVVEESIPADETSVPMVPEGYQAVKYTGGGTLGFPFGTEDNMVRYTIGRQPVVLPDNVAEHALNLYEGQIIPA